MKSIEEITKEIKDIKVTQDALIKMNLKTASDDLQHWVNALEWVLK